MVLFAYAAHTEAPALNEDCFITIKKPLGAALNIPYAGNSAGDNN